MRGPVLDKLINEERLRLPKGVPVEDLEVMVSLLLEARGISDMSQLTESEEIFALWVLCRWGAPIKPKEYPAEAAVLLSHFRGLAGNSALRAKFKARISPWFSKVDARPILKCHSYEIRIYEVLKRTRSQGLRVRARQFHAEYDLA